MVSRRVVAAAVVVGLMANSVSGCASSAGAPGTVSIVASTDVYGDIASQIAGRLTGHKVSVTSIITDPDADPHSYEASTRNQLAVKRADVVIENGGGYDDFVSTLRSASGSRPTVLNVVDISGKKAHGGTDLNEHVWYDFPTVRRLVDRLTDVLVAKDHSDAAVLRANAARFRTRLAALEHAEARIKATAAGHGIAVTEPVPLYLLTACGLVNRTPAAFSQAVEDGIEVAPRALQQTRQLFSDHRVSLLVYNEQTSGRDTDAVQAAARANRIPAVPVTETLPAGQTYLTWMSGILTAVSAALTQ